MTIYTTEDLISKYGFEVRKVETLAAYLEERKPETIYLNKGVDSDSGLTTDFPDMDKLGVPGDCDVNTTRMHDILAEARVIKNDEEINAMRWASQITAEAHCHVLRNVAAGMREMQIESHFGFYGQQNYFTGRVAPYLSICGCGPTAATLHY
jgi:Xaa-Pro dipeptidase